MIKKLLLIFPLCLTLSMGIEEANIELTMESKTDSITSILKTSLSSQQKREKIVDSVKNVFDYDTMAKISLGKRWKHLNNSEKNTFTKAFTKKLQHSYYDKLELYTDEQITNNPPQKIKSNRIVVKSDVKGKDKTYEIIYKFYKERGKNNWLIYDINISGVSMIQSYRKQFSEFLKTKSFDQLIRSL
ncbi:MAG: ABC transporter substrate-binding protein [Sulfurimonas sp.]